MKNKTIGSLLFMSFLCLIIFLSCSDDNNSSYVERGGNIEIRNTSVITWYILRVDGKGSSRVRPGGYTIWSVYSDGYYDVEYHDADETSSNINWRWKSAYVTKGRTVIVEIP